MSPLQTLAPDQRATLELLLRQGRSYGELSELLGIPEAGVRTRALNALEALAPAPAPPREKARIADWLLSQQDSGEAGATRAMLRRTPAAREWAAAVADRLREVDAERVPDLPEAAAEPPAPRPRPLRAAAGEEPARPAATRAGHGADAPGSGAVTLPRASRAGGAILIGVLALVVGGLLLVFLTRDDDGDSQSAANPAAPAQTATPAATPEVVNEVVLRGAGGEEAQGLLRVFKREQDGKLVFALAAEKVPRNTNREVYAVWFTSKGGGAQRLGFAQTQVGRDGVLTTGGPQQGQETNFARWLASFDTVLVTRERDAQGTKPGPAILRGTLPGGQ